MTPTVGSMLCAFVQSMADKTNKFHSTLAKQIVSTAEKLDLENNINHFTSTMKHVDRTLGRIVNNNAIHEDAELADIRRDLEIEIGNFDHKVGVYKKYPTLAINSLLLLHVYVLAFDVLLKQKKPKITQSTEMICDINRMLYEYRNLTVNDRLHMIEVAGTYFFLDDKAKKIKDKLIPIIGSLPYNKNGYKEGGSKTIECTKMREIKSLPPMIMYIKDGNNSFYDHKASKNIESCLSEYMKFARHEVEKFFDKPLTLTNLVCFAKGKDNAIADKGNSHTQTNIFSSHIFKRNFLILDFS